MRGRPSAPPLTLRGRGHPPVRRCHPWRQDDKATTNPVPDQDPGSGRSQSTLAAMIEDRGPPGLPFGRGACIAYQTASSNTDVKHLPLLTQGNYTGIWLSVCAACCHLGRRITSGGVPDPRSKQNRHQDQDDDRQGVQTERSFDPSSVHPADPVHTEQESSRRKLGGQRVEDEE